MCPECEGGLKSLKALCYSVCVLFASCLWFKIWVLSFCLHAVCFLLQKYCTKAASNLSVTVSLTNLFFHKVIRMFYHSDSKVTNELIKLRFQFFFVFKISYVDTMKFDHIYFISLSTFFFFPATCFFTSTCHIFNNLLRLLNAPCMYMALSPFTGKDVPIIKNESLFTNNYPLPIGLQ